MLKAGRKTPQTNVADVIDTTTDTLVSATDAVTAAVGDAVTAPVAAVQAVTNAKASTTTSAGTVAQAASLQSSTTVTAFTVSDTAANIAAAFATLNADTKLTSITVTNGLPITLTYTQYSTDTTAVKLLVAGTTLTLSAVPVTDAGAVQALSVVTSFAVTDTAANITAGLAALSAATKLSSITLSGGTSLAITFTQYQTYTKILDKIAAGDSMTVSAVTSAAVATVQADTHVVTFTVTDTGSNIVASLAALNTATKLTSITVSGGTTVPITYAQYSAYSSKLALLAAADTLTVSAVATANAKTIQAATKVSAFAVTDTTANIVANLATLAADSKLSSISLASGTTLAVTGAQYLADTSTLDKLVAGDTMTVSAATVASAAALQANSHVGSFAITDTATNITNGIASFGADAKLTAITLSSGTSITVTYAEYQADTRVLTTLPSGDTMIVTGVTAAAAATVAVNAHVKTLTVTDTLANIGTSLSSLETLATSGQLTGIAVSDSGQNLSLTAAQYTANQAAIKLMAGTFTITHPVINLIWDASVTNAPAGFVAAVEDAANYFDALITSPITVNIDIGYGEYDGTTMPSGALGETQILNSDYITTAQFKTDLAAMPSTSATTSALAHLSAAGEPTSVLVEGGEAKALGATAAYGTEVDAAIGFAPDPTGTLFSYNPAAQAVAGEYDFLAVAEAEIGHALGRVSLAGISTALDLYRYTSAGTIGVPGSSPSYFSINGGTTNLDNFATSLDYGDWAASAGNDAVDAVVPTGVQEPFTTTDVTELNVLGYGIAANAPSSTTVIPASAAGGLNASNLTFIGSPVAVTMSSTTTSVTAAIPPAAGIEEIANFTYGTDKLTLNLGDLSGSLEAFDTMIGGVHAIAIAGSNDLTNGVILTGMPTADTAANLLASHLTLSGSTATIT